jgi:hypothetical protein
MKKIVDAETMQPVNPQVAYLDGYVLADRQLEGVMFKIAIDGDGNPVCRGVHPRHKSYYDEFSDKKKREWEKNAVDEGYSDSLTTLDGRRDLIIVDAA